MFQRAICERKLRIKKYSYDGGSRTLIVDPEGGEQHWRYDAYGNPFSVKDPEGRETFYQYSPSGDLMTIIAPGGAAWTNRYDEHGALSQAMDAAGHTFEIVNNAHGQPVQIMRADGLMESRTYDQLGRLTAYNDFRGETWRFGHDGFGRMMMAQAPDGTITKLKYDDRSGTDFWTPSGVVRPDGVEICRIFDRSLRRMTVHDGEGRQTVYQYGPFDLLMELQDPKGGTLRFSYDYNERLESVTNQQGLIWTFGRDAAGRVIKERDFGGLELHYTYDKADRVIETRYMDGARLVFAYDRSGLLVREEAYSADGVLEETTRFSYDGRGLLQRSENSAAVVEFERDKLGRITAETLNGREVKSSYDCCGNRVAREIGGRLIEQAYDPLGAIKSLTIGSHNPLRFKRDALGRELSRESSAGFKLEQAYDPVGQLLKQVAGFSMAALGTGIEGAMAAQHLGIDPQKATRQVERAYSWTKAFEPLTIADKRWGETAYTYDENGQIEQASFGDGYAERFSYDAALNIAGFGEGLGPERKTFIGSGAAGSGYKPSVDKGKFEAWQGAAGGRVTEAKGPNGERVYLSYDIRGRVTERRLERNGFRSRTWRYTWDAKDRLIGCLTPEQERWTYGYDPFGRRVFKINASKAKLAARAVGITLPGDEQRGAFHEDKRLPKDEDNGRQTKVGTAYQWDGHSLAEEAPLTLGGTALWDEATRWHYEPGSFRPLAKETPDGKLLYIVTDHLGTPKEMFSEEGTLQWAAEYRTWGGVRKLWQVDPDNDNLPLRENAKPKGIGHLSGNKIPSSRGVSYGNLALKDDLVWQEATLQCPIRFQGQWEDRETGLYYNRFRYYDSITYQYCSSDPIGIFGGIRSYGYAYNTTVWIDPLGLACCKFGNPREYNRGSRKFTLEQGDSKSGWQHIYERHVDQNNPIFGNSGKSYFPSSWSNDDISDALNQTLKHGSESNFHDMSVFNYRYQGPDGNYNWYRATTWPDGRVQSFHPLNGSP